MDTIDPRLRRLLAIALLVGAVAVVYLLAVYPLVQTFRGYTQSIAVLRADLSRYQRIAFRSREAEVNLQQLTKKAPRQAYYLQGGTAALASAELQQYLKRVAAASRGELISTQGMAREGSEGLASVALRVQVKGDLSSLMNMFHTLEGGTPVAVLENVVVAARPSRHNATTGAARAGDLDIRFDLVAFMRVEGGV